MMYCRACAFLITMKQNIYNSVYASMSDKEFILYTCNISEIK